MPQRIRAAYFSRGRGFGHALADIDLARRLEGIDSKFISYASGAAAFASQGVQAIDLRLPEANPFFPTLLMAHRLIKSYKPDIVFSREEFAVLPAASLAGVPAIFLSDWLPPPSSMQAEALAFASSVFIFEDAGIFPLMNLKDIRPTFLGVVQRKLRCEAQDRAAMRKKFGLEATDVIIGVVAGGWFTEARAPIASLILRAFGALKIGNKRLLWVTGRGEDGATHQMRETEDVTVFGFVDPIEELMVACDLVITKGTRGATRDSGTLGVPTLSISNGSNPVDEMIVPRIRTNLALRSDALDPEVLAKHMIRTLRSPKPPPLKYPDETEAGRVISRAALQYVGLPGKSLLGRGTFSHNDAHLAGGF